MRRSDDRRRWLHPFQPGRMVLGLAMGGVALAYGGEAAGWWDTEWYAAIPIVVLGLFLASVAGIIAYAVRRRRGARVLPPTDDRTDIGAGAREG